MLRIDRLLREAECIDIYATGISYTLAQAAAFKFATLGVESSAYESINGHYLAARKHKKTVAFVISFTGANRTVETMAKYLRTATHNHVVGIAISMAVGFVLTMVFYHDPETAQAEPAPAAGTAAQVKNTVIASPVKGKVIALRDVKDEAFSADVLGLGAAVLPEDDTIYAPADGIVENMFSTGHAIDLVTDTGAEVLIHVGMDTVQLQGKGFQPLVRSGDAVKKGQPLLKFDRKLIEAAGYSLVTPVIITNSDDYAAVAAAGTAAVNAGDTLLTLS